MLRIGLVLSVILLISGIAFAAEEKAEDVVFVEGMTQGEFALAVIKAAEGEGLLPPAALETDACKLMSGFGFEPQGGWDVDAEITVKDIAYMLGISEEEAAKYTFDELVEMLVQKVKDAIANSTGQPKPPVSGI